ncbi:MAG: DUF2970 domain-containing protein [Herbaspirillum sp.]
MPNSDPNKPVHKVSFLYTLRAIAWSFIGLRRTKDFNHDVTGLNPVHVIIAGLIGLVIFISTLFILVRIAVS